MMLPFACIEHALANNGRAVSLRRGFATKLAKLHRRDIDVNVDPIQQWSGDAADVALNLIQRTATLAGRVIPEATRAWVRCPFAMSSEELGK